MAMMQENNRQYYEGAQGFIGDAGGTAGQVFTTTFNTDLIFKAFAPTSANYALNNFKLYTCLLYTSPSPRDRQKSRIPSSA